MKIIATLLVTTLILCGCSTRGGIYKSNDPENGDFSLGRTLLTILAVAGAAAIARNGGGSGGSGYAPQDYDWAWDEFYNENYQLVWACRGKQTGQFSDFDRCSGKLKIDNEWPGKSISQK